MANGHVQWWEPQRRAFSAHHTTTNISYQYQFQIGYEERIFKASQMLRLSASEFVRRSTAAVQLAVQIFLLGYSCPVYPFKACWQTGRTISPDTTQLAKFLIFIVMSLITAYIYYSCYSFYILFIYSIACTSLQLRQLAATVFQPVGTPSGDSPNVGQRVTSFETRDLHRVHWVH